MGWCWVCFRCCVCGCVGLIGLLVCCWLGGCVGGCWCYVVVVRGGGWW